MTRQFQKPTPDPNAADDDPPHSSHLGNELLARHNLAKKSVLNSLADAQQNSNKAQAGMGCDGMGLGSAGLAVARRQSWETSMTISTGIRLNWPGGDFFIERGI